MSKKLQHLMLIEDGETLVNELFRTRRERAEYLIDSIKNGAYGDDESFAELLQEQDEEALQADYPEGQSARLPEPEDRMDGLKEWLCEHGVDMFFEELELPEGVIAS